MIVSQSHVASLARRIPPTSALVGLQFTTMEHTLKMPFNISSGGVSSARAVVTALELADGTVGIGESAPFPAVSGETVESTLEVLKQIAARLAALPPDDAIGFIGCQAFTTEYRHAPAARCGVEMALLDASLRTAGRSLQDWMPPNVDQITTDITLPICGTDDALIFVEDVVSKGFNTLKIKVGTRDIPDEVSLIAEIARAFPRLTLLLDANCAYDLSSARNLLRGLDAAQVSIGLLEQPLAKDAFAETATLQRNTDVLICLDESLRDVADFDAICAFPELRSINIKTMKMGLRPAVEVLSLAADRGMQCMIGGMVESVLSMTVSAAMAMHFSEAVCFVDLDTPLFMLPGPISGGMTFDGERIRLMPGKPGLGCSLRHG